MGSNAPGGSVFSRQADQPHDRDSMDDDKNASSNAKYPSRRDAEFPEHHVADDEISLYDLWNVLVRRLPVMIGVGGVVVLAGLVYALMQPVEYQYRSGLDLPRVYDPEDGLSVVVARQSVIATLEDIVIPEQRQGLFGDEERGPRVNVVERGGDHSLVLESGSTPERAERVSRLHEAIIESLAERLEGDYERRLSVSVGPYENRRTMLDEQIDVLTSELASLNNRLDGADGVSSLVVAQQLGDIRRELAELRSRRVDADSAVESIRGTSHGAEQTYLASESENPTGPGRTLIMALTVVLGGMLGLFSAFFWEFVSNARRYRHGN